MFYDMFARVKMNIDLAEKESHTFASKGERRALRQAKEAERAFRESKGYAPDTLWARLKKRLHP